MRSPLFAFLVVTACGGATPAPAPPGPPPASCDALHVSLAGTASTDEPVKVTALLGEDATSAIADAESAGAHAAIAACHDDHWTVEAIDCFVRAPTDDDQRACTAALPPAAARGLRAHVDAAVRVLSTVALTRGDGPEWHDAPADTGVPACDDFIRGFNAFMRCDKLPDQARDSAAVSMQRMIDGFAPLRDPSVSAEVKQQAADGCTKALAAMRENAAMMSCPLP